MITDDTVNRGIGILPMRTTTVPVVNHSPFHNREMDLPYEVWLASGSPRRRELLRELVATFRIEAPDVDETIPEGMDPWQAAEYLASMKAEEVRRRHGGLVIGGDTIVAVSQGTTYAMLGKPSDEEEARAMLRQLSGREHIVVTGLAVLGPDREFRGSDTTRVAFRSLTDEEIATYVATGEPMDKAGAYALQGGAAPFVSAIEGSRTNVIGLPMELLERALASVRG